VQLFLLLDIFADGKKNLPGAHCTPETLRENADMISALLIAEVQGMGSKTIIRRTNERGSKGDDPADQ